MNKRWQLLALGVVLCTVQGSRAGVTLFSSGYSLPETITPVPAGFGSYGGGYLVDDLGGTNGNSTIWYAGASGGAPTAVVTSQGLSAAQSFWRGGTFVPADFGSVSAAVQPAAGSQFLFSTAAGLMTMNGSGQLRQFTNTTGSGYSGLTTPVIAPSSFGNLGGTLFVTAQTGPTPGVGGVLKVNPDGTFSNFASVAVNPFGLAFAPANFGSAGGKMLVSDSNSGNLYSVDSGGNVSLFATLPFTGQGGLRQMAFAGGDFGRFSGDLLVSVSASSFGGGALGSVDVLDGSGTLVGELLAGTSQHAFDPRGITLIGNGQALISDASDPIYLFSVADISVVPEPTGVAGFFIGMAALFGARRLRRREVRV